MDLRTHIIGLIISCPLSTVHNDCPFMHYRNQPLDQIGDLVKNLSSEEITALSNHHKKCLTNRLNEIGKETATVQLQKTEKRENLPFYHFLAF